MKTQGLSPKVPATAIVTVLAWLLSYFGVDLTPEVSLAIATLLGFIAGFVAPPGKVVPK